MRVFLVYVKEREEESACVLVLIKWACHVEERQESLGSINDFFGVGVGVDKKDRRCTFNMSVTDHTETAIKHLHKHKGCRKDKSRAEIHISL